MKNPFSYILGLSIVCLATLTHASTFFYDDTGRKTVQHDSIERRQLFNGKDLTGWKHVGDGYMTVEDGIIQTHGGMGLLYWTGDIDGGFSMGCYTPGKKHL